MPVNTPFLGLKTYNAGTDASALFLTFRTDIAGVATEGLSNMVLIDTFASSTSASITALQARRSSVDVNATAIISGTGSYEATVSGVTAYTDTMLIVLSLDETNPGVTTLNINSIGTKTVQKVDFGGNLIDLSENDLILNRKYLFEYVASYDVWVWINSVSIDQLYVSGSLTNVLSLGTNGTIVDSGISASSIGLVNNSYVTLTLNPNLTNQSVLSDGYGTTVRSSLSASTVSLDLTAQPPLYVSGSKTLLAIDGTLSLTSGSLTLAASGTTSGSFNLVNVDAYGRVTSGCVVYIPIVATGAEIDTGTDNQKYVTPYAITHSANVPHVAPTTAGNVLTAMSGSWISASPTSSGHVIQDEGVVLPTQPALDFVGAGVSASNVSSASATRIEVDWNMNSTIVQSTATVTIPASIGSVIVGPLDIQGVLVVTGRMVIL